jgi:hypothetical protein
MTDAQYTWWIGGTNWNEEKRWVWDNNARAIDLKSKGWVPNEPNNFLDSGEHCLELNDWINHSGSFLMNDQPCNGKYPFICEIEEPVNSGYVVE